MPRNDSIKNLRVVMDKTDFLDPTTPKDINARLIFTSRKLMGSKIGGMGSSFGVYVHSRYLLFIGF